MYCSREPGHSPLSSILLFFVFPSFPVVFAEPNVPELQHDAAIGTRSRFDLRSPRVRYKLHAAIVTSVTFTGDHVSATLCRSAS